ncbi:Arabinogalactan protein [Thalictrum thalictroides]|uniref:Arabinogalactan protein n=1 Tax=Thalictrum thalictroides TaxID=46969 RepID=A0A7J6UT36_THATH|nr:Arabinogalactan protein [Thalictrum thalictroides]
MAISKVSFGVMLFVAMIISIVLPSAQAQAPAPAPASSDGTSIDQGIAYVLMLLALVLTYLIHPLDASSPISFF